MTPSEKKLHRPRRDVRPHVHTFSRTSPSEIDVHINELVLHGFEVGAGGVGEGGRAVPEVVQPDRGQPGPGDEDAEALADVVGV